MGYLDLHCAQGGVCGIVVAGMPVLSRFCSVETLMLGMLDGGCCSGAVGGFE